MRINKQIEKSVDIQEVKLKDLEKTMAKLKKKTGKTPFIKGKGSGSIKFRFQDQNEEIEKKI